MRGVLGAKAPNKRIWLAKFSACCNERRPSFVGGGLRLFSKITSRKRKSRRSSLLPLMLI